MGVEAYSTDPDLNTSQMPENQFPSTVNNGTRTIQAHLAELYNDPGWYRPGAPAPTITRLSADSFRISGVNVTSLYPEGTRVRVQGTLTGTIYGEVDSSSYSGGNTDVSVDWDSSGMAADTQITVSIGILNGFSTGWAPFAATDHRGMVRIATDAEVAALTATNLAISPGGLGEMDATTDQRGIVELSTTTQAREGTSSTTALTPKSLSANAEEANPGYLKFPGGWIMNAGSGVTGGDGQLTVVYPANYTTVAFTVATPFAVTFACPQISGQSTSQFAVRIVDENGVPIASMPFNWIAWGY